jgi:hypothetical protein
MAWPLSQDYNEAIQDPAQSFHDAELRAGQPTLNALGLPMPRSGNFADVYEVHCPATANKWAVKCFTREVPGLQQRYAAIGAHLAKLKLPFAVEFHYLEQGLRIRGQWCPILKMRWVEGLLLNEFVRGTLEKPAMLQALAQIQVRLARRLRESHIAHGDLQHGNIILVPAQSGNALAVKLIDYDGMFVPALARSKSGEVGHPSYQHPQRLRESLYGADVDRFPQLLTYAAIRCLLVGGRTLWDRYDNGDNLLFREQDLRNPGASALFRELWQVPEAAVHDVVGHLALAAAGPMDRVPLLDQLLIGGDVLPLSAVQEKEVAALLGPGAKVNRAAPKATAVTATPPASTATTEEDPLAFDFPPEPTAERRSPKSRSRNKSAGWVWAAVGGGVAALLVLGVGLGVAFSLMKQPRRDLAEQTKPGQVAESAHPKNPPAPTDLEIKPPPLIPVKPEPPPNPPANSNGNPPPAPAPAPPLAPGNSRRLETSTNLMASQFTFSADGRRLLGIEGAAFRLWDVDSGRILIRLQVPETFVTFAALCPDGRLGFTGDGEGNLRYWDLETGMQVRQLGSKMGRIYTMAVSTDGRRLITCHGDTMMEGGKVAIRDSRVRIWDVNSGEELAHTENFPNRVTQLATSSDGSRAVAASKGRVWLLDTAQAKILRRLAENLDLTTEELAGLALSSDGHLAALIAEDGRLVLWDVENNLEVRRWRTGAASAQFLRFTPDGLRFLAGCNYEERRGGQLVAVDHSVRLWEVSSGREFFCGRHHAEGIIGLFITLDGRRALSIDRGWTLWGWDLASVATGNAPTVKGPGDNPPPRPPVERKPVAMNRMAVPDATALAEAEKRIKKQYKDDYAKTKPAERAALASKLLEEGTTTNGAPTTRYALLHEANAVATLGGDLTTALKAIDQLAHEYEVDELELKLALLTAISKSVTTVAGQKALAESALVVLDDALAAEKYDAAVRVAGIAEQAARRAQSQTLLSRAEAKLKEVGEAKQEFEKSRAAAATLKDMPDDAEANLLLGKFLCFRKNDWDQGLPFLKKSKDAALSGLAEKELKNPATATEKREVADAWWDRSQAIEGTAKVPFLRRAYYWYTLCATGPEGPEKTDIDKRLRQLEKLVPGLEGPLDAVDLSNVRMVGGAAHLDGGKELPTRQQYTGPIEIDVVARTEAQNLRLRAHRGSAVIFNWEGKAGELRVHRPDGGVNVETGSVIASKPWPLTPRVWYHIRWLLTETGMTLSVDGVVVFQESGRYNLSGAETIRVAAMNSPLEVRSFSVKRTK